MSSNESLPATPRTRPAWRRVLRHPVTRMFIASISMFLALALGFALTEALLPHDMRVGWPSLAGALCCGLGYWLYVNRIEGRGAVELALAPAIPEWMFGAVLGTLIGLLTLPPRSPLLPRIW